MPLPLPAAPAGPSRVSRPDSAAGTGEPALRRGCAGDGPRAGDGAVCVAPRCRGRGVSPARPGAAAAGLRGGRAGRWALRGSRGGWQPPSPAPGVPRAGRAEPQPRGVRSAAGSAPGGAADSSAVTDAARAGPGAVLRRAVPLAERGPSEAGSRGGGREASARSWKFS